VVSNYGRHAVRAETVDGKLIQVPLAWTSMCPRPDPLRFRGQPVRLAADALREMVAWVAARKPMLQPTENKKFAPAVRRRDKENYGEHHSSGSGSVASVVGQTGSPDADCRNQRARRGRR